MVRSKKDVSFSKSVTSFKRVIKAAAKKNGGQVSSVDLIGSIPTVTGSRRGAVVRRAFTSLLEDGTLRTVKTKGLVRTIYNTETHHRVTVYALRKTRKST